MTDLDPSATTRSSATPQWHLHIPPETYGPYSLQQLRDYAREGRMSADTLVWTEGADGWGRAGDQAALRSLFPLAAPAWPAPPPAPAANAPRASASSYVLGSTGAVAGAANAASHASAGYVQAPSGRKMGFAEAVRTCLKIKYFDFRGRAARAEFWWFGLFAFIVIAIAYSIAGWLAFSTESHHMPSVRGYVALVVAGLVVLALFIPGVAVTVRRLHDLGWSGWWYLAQLIPVVGGVISLVMFIGFMMRGNVGFNRFGPDPLAGGF